MFLLIHSPFVLLRFVSSISIIQWCCNRISELAACRDDHPRLDTDWFEIGATPISISFSPSQYSSSTKAESNGAAWPTMFYSSSDASTSGVIHFTGSSKFCPGYMWTVFFKMVFVIRLINSFQVLFVCHLFRTLKWITWRLCNESVHLNLAILGADIGRNHADIIISEDMDLSFHSGFAVSRDNRDGVE